MIENLLGKSIAVSVKTSGSQQICYDAIIAYLLGFKHWAREQRYDVRCCIITRWNYYRGAPWHRVAQVLYGILASWFVLFFRFFITCGFYYTPLYQVSPCDATSSADFWREASSCAFVEWLSTFALLSFFRNELKRKYERRKVRWNENKFNSTVTYEVVEYLSKCFFA